MNNRNVGLILPRFLTIIGLITLSFFIVELPVHGFLSTYLGTFVSNPEILKGIKDIPNYLLFLIYSIFLLLNFKRRFWLLRLRNAFSSHRCIGKPTKSREKSRGYLSRTRNGRAHCCESSGTKERQWKEQYSC